MGQKSIFRDNFGSENLLSRNCNYSCVKGLSDFAIVPTEKIKAQCLPGLNAAFRVQYIDLLTNVRLKSVPRNIQTRSMPTIEVNLMVAVKEVCILYAQDNKLLLVH